MKEKRILAMFITSAVTLVASLAVTFGVLMTLADPVVATGVTRYQYAFNYTNDSSISIDGNTLKLKEDIIFQPASSVVWDEVVTDEETNEVLPPVWFNGSTIEDDIMYRDESISTRLKVIPFKISNKYTTSTLASIKVTFDNSTTLGKFTKVKIYKYNDPTPKFEDYTSEIPVEISADGSLEFAIVIFADDSNNISLTDTIDWGTDLLSINVEITDTTVRD